MRRNERSYRVPCIELCQKVFKPNYLPSYKTPKRVASSPTVIPEAPLFKELAGVLAEMGQSHHPEYLELKLSG